MEISTSRWLAKARSSSKTPFPYSNNPALQKQTPCSLAGWWRVVLSLQRPRAPIPRGMAHDFLWCSPSLGVVRRLNIRLTLSTASTPSTVIALPETVALSYTASSTCSCSSGPGAVQTRGNRITDPGQIEGSQEAGPGLSWECDYRTPPPRPGSRSRHRRAPNKSARRGGVIFAPQVTHRTMNGAGGVVTPNCTTVSARSSRASLYPAPAGAGYNFYQRFVQSERRNGPPQRLRRRSGMREGRD